MLDEFFKISELKSIRELRNSLAIEEKKLSMPTLTDLSYISTIFNWFCDLSGSSVEKGKYQEAKDRKEFTFIILFLYSPATLAGGQIANGIRKKLAEVFGFESPSTISNYIGKIVFQYNHYPDCQDDIDRLYTEIMTRLKEKGMI